MIAGPDFVGRGDDQFGYAAAAGYVAGWLRANGIAPAGPNGSYFQPVVLQEITSQPSECSLQSADGNFKLAFGNDFAGTTTESGTSHLKFAFLRVATDGDFSKVDLGSLKGYVLIVNPEARTRNRVGSLRFQQAAGLAGVQVVFPTSGDVTFEPSVFRTVKDAPPVGAFPVAGFRINVGAVERLAKAAKADAYLNPNAANLSVEKSDVDFVYKSKVTVVDKMKTVNVVAKIVGADPLLRDEAVVIGSHLDHFGVVARGVMWGADDNGSGVTANMLIARAIAQNPVKSKRTVVFGFWAAEELGLQGSWAYVNRPAVPMKSTIAYLNMDMVGRNAEFKSWGDRPEDNTDSVYAASAKLNSPDLYNLIRQTNQYINLHLRDDKEDRTMRSDTGSFVKMNVPTLKAMTGEHPDYHQLTDTIEKINFEKLTSVARWLYLTTEELASTNTKPRFESGATYIRGSITYLQKIALTPKATTEVSLFEVTNGVAKMLDRTLGSRVGQVPVYFALKYRPTELKPNATYAIVAKVFESGKLIFTNRTPLEVLSAGKGRDQVEVVVAPVSK